MTWIFTPNQQEQVFAERDAFNASETALASRQFLVGNASPLPLDAWRRIDGRATQVQRDKLVLFGKLAAASSTPVGMADLVNYYQQVSDSGEVILSMDGRQSGKGDKVLTRYQGTPVPILASDTARYGWREMAVMQRGGNLDLAQIANNQRRIAERLETMALDGDSTVNVGGNTIYGLRTFPARNTNTHGLTLASATGAQWLAAVKDLCAKLIADNAYGRVTVFVNFNDWFAAQNTDFAAAYPKSIATRLQEIEQVAEFVPVPRLPANELIGIADLSSGNWGSILSGMPITTRPLARHNPEDDYAFSCIASASVQLRSDYNGQSTIAHLTQS